MSVYVSETTKYYIWVLLFTPLRARVRPRQGYKVSYVLRVVLVVLVVLVVVVVVVDVDVVVVVVVVVVGGGGGGGVVVVVVVGQIF